MTEFIQVVTTTATKDEALRIARKLVEERLAACAQVSGPITSVYRWQGKVEQAEEWYCTIKTRQSLFAQVAAAIREVHSYECPEIVATAVDHISDDYQAWLEREIAG